MKRIFLIFILAAALTAGAWQSLFAGTYTCSRASGQTASCAVDDRAWEKDGRVVFSCGDSAGAAAREIACDMMYAPLQGYTYTGMLGYNWQCGGITVSHAELQDHRSMCGRICGACEGGWQ